ncbi:MAG: hypothetical protein JOZ14_09720 [Acidobacteria bacterium]|nr:hypothetical protein [Acidobacteriota bacterium]
MATSRRPFSVERFPALAFFLGIDQRQFRALDHWNVRPVGNFEQTQDVLGFFLYPLVSADGCDAEDFKLLRLKKNQYCLLVAGTRPAGVLIHDDLQLLSV